MLNSIGGSVEECSPATRAARVRLPADARILLKQIAFLVGNIHARVEYFFLKELPVRLKMLEKIHTEFS